MHQLPHALTLCNLLCGCCALLYTLYWQPEIAAWFTAGSFFFDYLDGMAARALKVTSPMGKELDSLADAISFGLLPAFMLYALYLPAAPRMWVSFSPLIVAVFTAIRLAKFNVDSRQAESFLGLPSPASALLIASAVFYTTGNPSWKEFMQTSWFIPCISVVISFLLISGLPMFSLKFQGFSFGRNKVRFIFLGLCLALAVLLLATGNHPGLAMMGCICLYIVMSGIVRISGHQHHGS